LKNKKQILNQHRVFYTVVVGFEDHTNGIEQYETACPEAAMAMFLREAECLAEVDPVGRKTVSQSHIKLLKIKKLDGLWIWNMTRSTVPKMPGVLGGYVVRTARTATIQKV
jgi:hypothetical protein